jgi:uncharacterized protein YdaU (DUF1376 family)
MGKPYMPLMMGDWIKGTRGMRADVKGVYIGLLIHQYDHGYLPSDVEDLALIEPEVGKVWVKLKEKFEEFEPGKLRNKKLEEVRDFWNKQGQNGKKGGRPKKENPKQNPNDNPKANPNTNHHNDIDLDNDTVLKNKKEREKFFSPDVDGDTIIFPFDTDLMRNLWASWKEARWINHEETYGMYGEQAELKKLQGLNFQEVESTITQAIAGKWKNLYPEKNGTHGNARKSNGITAEGTRDRLNSYT